MLSLALGIADTFVGCYFFMGVIVGFIVVAFWGHSWRHSWALVYLNLFPPPEFKLEKFIFILFDIFEQRHASLLVAW